MDSRIQTILNKLRTLVNLTESKQDELSAGDRISIVENEISADVSDIEALIPEQATVQNQLADKAFVNSTVGTNTAIFRGTFNSLAELEAITEKTNNDYAFVIGTDSAGNTVYNRYKYNGSSWVYEYALNNSSFTAEQWNTINSGLTAESLDGKEDTTNKVTTVSAQSTDAEYPSAKLFYDTAISKKNVPNKVITGTNLLLADNTEYRLNIASGVNAVFSLPSGEYECFMRLTIASGSAPSITFTPASGETLKYIGSAPDFQSGEIWEISIKDGIIAAVKVK